MNILTNWIIALGVGLLSISVAKAQITECSGCKIVDLICQIPAGKTCLDGANLRDSSINNTDAPGVNFQGGDIRSLDVRHSNFRRANFRGLKMINSRFWNVNLRGANFKGANMGGVVMYGVDLRDTSSGHTTKISQSQLDGINGDKCTKIPASGSLKRPNHWSATCSHF